MHPGRLTTSWFARLLQAQPTWSLHGNHPNQTPQKRTARESANVACRHVGRRARKSTQVLLSRLLMSKDAFDRQMNCVTDAPLRWPPTCFWIGWPVSGSDSLYQAWLEDVGGGSCGKRLPRPRRYPQQQRQVRLELAAPFLTGLAPSPHGGAAKLLPKSDLIVHKRVT